MLKLKTLRKLITDNELRFDELSKPISGSRIYVRIVKHLRLSVGAIMYQIERQW